jgi:hypothetical protein
VNQPTHTFAFCRVYFNRRDDPQGCWSIDYGPGTPEIIVKSVTWVDVDIVKTDEDLSQHGPEAVSAWTAMRDVAGYLTDDGNMVLRPAH